MPSPTEDMALLADKTRLRLLRLLAERPLTVSQLETLLDISQSALSQHLARLRLGGYVEDERQGQKVLYRLRRERLGDVIGDLRRFFLTPLWDLPLLAPQRELWREMEEGKAPVKVFAGPGNGRQLAVQDEWNVLFVCTGNSARSQMAEGFLNAFSGPEIRAASAGLEPAGVHPLAIQAMAEAGVDLGSHTSKALGPEQLEAADLVVTLCGGPSGWRPSGEKVLPWQYWVLQDPARATGSKEERLRVFRQVRDEIRLRTVNLLRDLGATA